MKIGVILPEVERWSSYYGGALARYSYEMTKYTDLVKYDINIYGKSCHSKFAYKIPINEPLFGILPIKFDSFLTKLRKGFAGWIYIMSMYRGIKKNDILHIHNRPFYAMILRRLGYEGKIIIHLNNDFNKSSKDYAKRFIDASDMIVSCSQKIADRLFEKYPEASEKSRISYNGADKIFTYSDMKLRQNKILFVGRIDEIKGVHNLLDAFEKVLHTYPNWELTLAGSATFGGKKKLTKYEQLIQSKILKINREKVKVKHLGYVEHTALPELFKESKIFCLPSVVHDAFPFVVIESMFTGTPVVASRMGGIPEAVGEYGVLCDPNVSSLCKGLIKSIEDEKLIKE